VYLSTVNVLRFCPPLYSWHFVKQSLLGFKVRLGDAKTQFTITKYEDIMRNKGFHPFVFVEICELRFSLFLQVTSFRIPF